MRLASDNRPLAKKPTALTDKKSFISLPLTRGDMGASESKKNYKTITSASQKSSSLKPLEHQG